MKKSLTIKIYFFLSTGRRETTNQLSVEVKYGLQFNSIYCILCTKLYTVCVTPSYYTYYTRVFFLIYSKLMANYKKT